VPERSATSAKPTVAKPTITAVADRADVAISTVSRVLNGGRTSEEIRRRVRLAIEELGYAPSVAARNLVRRRTDCIGLAVNSTQSPWFSEILVGIEEALVQSRKSVLLASMMLHGAYDPAPVQSWIQERRIDGLILVRFSRRDQPLFQSATDHGVPVALIAPDLPADAAYSVRSDNLRAGELVADHLAALGHRSVGFASGPHESVDGRERLQGLERGLGRHGVVINPRHVEFAAVYGRDPAIAYARAFLKLPRRERPTAVVLGNDTMALAFMRTVLQGGLLVPKDVSVVGFDGTPDGEQCWPSLTTVVQATRRMSREACAALLHRIDRDPTASGREQYPVELLIRESSGRVGKA
jgi:DNA-binding LacI/PurR family transcriptional regulator